ncbi:hypothetical protein OROGR_004935 [Orobanche gracilis]
MDPIPKRRRYTEKAPVNGKTTDDDGSNTNGMDIISNLPIEVLCHILSFLPTKYAVGTSILSTKWKNLLPLIPNLRLCIQDNLLLHPESASTTDLISFMKFADTLLNVTLRDVTSLRSFTLICKKFDDGRLIASWISAALRLNIKRMDIRIQRPKNTSFLLNSLFGCHIVSLNLFLHFSQDVTEFRFSFPNLKMLCVQYMRFHPVNVLLACCPVLEYLILQNCYCYDPGERLRICIPSLKALKLWTCIPSPKASKIVRRLYWVNCVIELDTPELVYLNHCGYLPIRYLAEKMKSLWLARLDLYENVGRHLFDSDEQAAVILKVCADAEQLWLSETFISMLYRHPHRLPRFQKLVDLAIKNMNSHAWEVLPSLLASAPNLKNLYLKGGFDNQCYEIFKGFVKESMSICLSRYTDKCFHLAIERKVENC